MLRVPADALPDDPDERHAALRAYFCDKDAVARRADEGWLLELAWPAGRDRHVDPRIEDALAAEWGGIALSEMWRARRRTGRVLTCLYDTWTLHSWSEWLARRPTGAECPVTVLHLDDHRDLGSPRLEGAGVEWRDMVTGRPVSLRDPDGVLAGVESGALGMGSFLTPFLHAMPHADVRQLAQAPKVTATADYRIEPTTALDDLLDPGAKRPAVRLVPSDEGAGPGRYRATGDLDWWLEGIGPGPVLLHVDMDYFSNRYDGDSDWMDRRMRLDPPLEQVLARIDAVGGALRDAGILDRVEDAVVAFSPGFFPAELWQPAGRRIAKLLKGLHG